MTHRIDIRALKQASETENQSSGHTYEQFVITKERNNLILQLSIKSYHFSLAINRTNYFYFKRFIYSSNGLF